MRPLSSTYAAANTVILLLTALSQPVLAAPQVTASDAIYLTDPALGVTTFTESLVAVTDVNGLLTTVSVDALTTTTAAAVVADTPVTNVLGPAPATVYSYTTTDALGNTLTVTDTFTPTYQATVFPTSYKAGTILAYSDWTKIYATATGKSSSGNLRRPFEGASSALWTAAATVVGLIAGAGAVALL